MFGRSVSGSCALCRNIWGHAFCTLAYEEAHLWLTRTLERRRAKRFCRKESGEEASHSFVLDSERSLRSYEGDAWSFTLFITVKTFTIPNLELSGKLEIIIEKISRSWQKLSSKSVHAHVLLNWATLSYARHKKLIKKGWWNLMWFVHISVVAER